MSFLRWTFTDPSDSSTYTVAINPNQMDAPFLPNTTDAAAFSPIDGGSRSWRQPRQPLEWSFGGVIRTQAHLDTLQAWFERDGKLQLTDHLNRTFEIRIVSFDPLPQKPTRHVTWRYTYTIKALLYRRVS